ncbi:MAG: glycoside hydrolase family 2 protein [Anaerolinea sp.]|nr:glycoside hydrolase family 2 protein [Anaerolinea sp.]
MNHHLSLNGQWLLARAGSAESIPASVPGCVHLDLMNAGRIPDLLYRDNEADLLWIGETDWQYTRTFTVPAELLDQPQVKLVCSGLDTLATLTLNGVEIGTADNMYRRWEYDVKSTLRAGENTLVIRFDSPMSYLRRRDAEERVLPAWVGPDKVHGGGWLRKEPCNFGWDWGPRVVTSGIWRDISVIGCAARLTEVKIDQQHADGQVTLDIGVQTEGSAAGSVVKVNVWLDTDGDPLTGVEVPVNANAASARLTIPDPQLWWVNGMGEQPLYTVTVELFDAERVYLDAVEKRIGLRTLTLDRHADEWGESFQFVINGVPFFAKGANWIPADVFAPRMTRERYAALIESAVDAHMNMLRVWGGGIYEDDDFYALCDQHGIAIWQDFMFACGTYPGFDQAFCQNVAVEVAEQVRRLRHHACIALWCGNNELEQGLVGEAWTDRTMSWEDYSTLFDRLLPEVIRQHDPERPYVPSSPHNPTGNRYQHSNPESGDAHLWEVWHGKKPFEWYRTAAHRFASEFGFQSFPEPLTMNAVTLPEDRNITSYVMEFRQRSGIGNTTIMQYMLEWFKLPRGYEESLWLSQILQGIGMQYGIEHWRRNMPRTMGTLYWQLNDCWEAPSWASIDYHGRWKALHYMAKRFYAPILISGVEHPDTGTVDVYLTSDHGDARTGVIRWTVTTAAGALIERGRSDAITPVRGSTLSVTLDVSTALRTVGARDLLVWLAFDSGGETAADNLVLFARPKHLKLSAPNIHAEKHGADELRLEADSAALWVWVAGAGRCSDNFFHLLPGQPKTIRVEHGDAQIVVRSLIDT